MISAVTTRLGRLLAGDGLKARAARGSGLTVFKLVVNKGMRLASNLVLTRLLFPEAFGMMAIVAIVLTAVGMLSDVGLRGSIVSDKRADDPVFIDTAWTVQVIRGFLLGLAVFLFAEPVAAFYGEPLLAELLRIAALHPVIAGFNSIRLLTANRHIRLGRITVIELGVQAVGALMTIALAWWLQSVWALLIGGFFGTTATMILSHAFLPGHQDRFGIERDAFGRLFRFGRWIFFATMASFVIQQGDRALLGRFVSIEMLGIYNIALIMGVLPRVLGMQLIQSVLYPLFARRPPQDSAENRWKINRARFMLTPVTLSGAILLAFTGDWIIRFLYDDRYILAGPMMMLVALTMMPRIIGSSYQHLPLAAGDSRLYALMTISISVVQFIVMYLGVTNFGVAGVILAQGLGFVLTYPVLIAVARRYRGWDPRHDAVFFGTALLATIGVFALRGEAFEPLFAAL